MALEQKVLEQKVLEQKIQAHMPKPRSINAGSWSKEEVHSFFIDVGCPKLVSDTLFDNDFTGLWLYELREDDYLDELGLLEEKDRINAALDLLYVKGEG